MRRLMRSILTLHKNIPPANRFFTVFRVFSASPVTPGTAFARRKPICGASLGIPIKKVSSERALQNARQLPGLVFKDF